MKYVSDPFPSSASLSRSERTVREPNKWIMKYGYSVSAQPHEPLQIVFKMPLQFHSFCCPGMIMSAAEAIRHYFSYFMVLHEPHSTGT